MAIQTDIQYSQFGVPFTGAYFRIVGANVSRENTEHKHTVKIDISGYATQPQHDDIREVDFRRYHAPLADVEAQVGDTFLAKCYAWLMQQPDMQGSVGV
jgi:hypothetical protein